MNYCDEPVRPVLLSVRLICPSAPPVLSVRPSHPSIVPYLRKYTAELHQIFVHVDFDDTWIVLWVTAKLNPLNPALTAVHARSPSPFLILYWTSLFLTLSWSVSDLPVHYSINQSINVLFQTENVHSKYVIIIKAINGNKNTKVKTYTHYIPILMRYQS